MNQLVFHLLCGKHTSNTTDFNIVAVDVTTDFSARLQKQSRERKGIKKGGSNVKCDCAQSAGILPQTTGQKPCPFLDSSWKVHNRNVRGVASAKNIYNGVHKFFYWRLGRNIPDDHPPKSRRRRPRGIAVCSDFSGHSFFQT